MDEHRIEYLPLGSISFADKNPKEHDLGALHESIARFGYAESPMRDERTGKLVAGHGRVMALRQMQSKGGKPPNGVKLLANGEWSIPVLCGWRSKDDRDAEGYLLASNQTTILGGWDDAALADLLQQNAASLDGTGFDLQDLDSLLKTLSPLAGSEIRGLTPDERAEVYENTDVRQIVLLYRAAEFAEIEGLLSACRKQMVLETNTHVFTRLLREYAKNHSLKVEDRPEEPEVSKCPDQ